MIGNFNNGCALKNVSLVIYRLLEKKNEMNGKVFVAFTLCL